MLRLLRKDQVYLSFSKTLWIVHQNCLWCCFFVFRRLLITGGATTCSDRILPNAPGHLWISFAKYIPSSFVCFSDNNDILIKIWIFDWARWQRGGGVVERGVDKWCIWVLFILLSLLQPCLSPSPPHSISDHFRSNFCCRYYPWTKLNKSFWCGWGGGVEVSPSTLRPAVRSIVITVCGQRHYTALYEEPGNRCNSNQNDLNLKGGGLCNRRLNIHPPGSCSLYFYLSTLFNYSAGCLFSCFFWVHCIRHVAHLGICKGAIEC